MKNISLIALTCLVGCVDSQEGNLTTATSERTPVATSEVSVGQFDGSGDYVTEYCEPRTTCVVGGDEWTCFFACGDNPLGAWCRAYDTFDPKPGDVGYCVSGAEP